MVAEAGEMGANLQQGSEFQSCHRICLPLRVVVAGQGETGRGKLVDCYP